MNREEEKENLYSILLHRNSFNHAMIKKFIKKINSSRKGIPYQSSKPLVFPTLTTIPENSKD